jgi:hypothetical protein
LSLALKRQAFFMISGPILEELLLSQKAVYRNISVGGAGLVQVRVPEGKTWIVTKIHICPFLNIIDRSELYANAETFEQEVLNQNFAGILKRIQYQLLFYNPRINSVYNVRNKFGLQTISITGDDRTQPFLQVEDQKFDTFHIVGDNFYLLLKYFDFGEFNNIGGTDPYSIIFDGAQSWPATNPYGYANTTEDLAFYNLSNFSYVYQPQSSNTYAANQGFNLQDQFLLPTTSGETNFINPIGSQTSGDILPKTLPSIPFYNLSVIEINKRLTTNGIL